MASMASLAFQLPNLPTSRYDLMTWWPVSMTCLKHSQDFSRHHVELLARSAWPCRAAHIVAVLQVQKDSERLWHSMAFSQVEGHTKRLGMVETWWDSVTDMCRPEPSPIGLLAANSHSTVWLIENSEKSPRIIGSVFCFSNLQKWIQPDLLSISDYSRGSSEPNSSPQSAASSAPAMISCFRFSCAIVRLC